MSSTDFMWNQNLGRRRFASHFVPSYLGPVYARVPYLRIVASKSRWCNFSRWPERSALPRERNAYSICTVRAAPEPTVGPIPCSPGGIYSSRVIRNQNRRFRWDHAYIWFSRECREFFSYENSSYFFEYDTFMKNLVSELPCFHLVIEAYVAYFRLKKTFVRKHQ